MQARAIACLALSAGLLYADVARAAPVAPATSVTKAAPAHRWNFFKPRVAKHLAPGEVSTAHMSFGDKVAHHVANFAGSWRFLFLLSAGTTSWMAMHNLLGDPQLIKLNLSISIVTMLTGPLVLMSQNKSGERDRARAEQDLRVNIKAEKEVAELHGKIDKLGEQLAMMNARLEAQQAAPKPTE